MIQWELHLSKINQMGLDGFTMKDIGEQYGVTRQRIKQVVDHYFPDWSATHGAAVKRSKKTNTQYSKWGVTEDTELYEIRKKKFRNKKYYVETTGGEWKVEFESISWPTHCPIIGIELDYFAETVKENSVSLDRKDRNKGHINDNLLVTSLQATRLRNHGTAQQLRQTAHYLDKNT